jgi:hypothetical protein
LGTPWPAQWSPHHQPHKTRKLTSIGFFGCLRIAVGLSGSTKPIIFELKLSTAIDSLIQINS